ncbi:NAD(+)/NADH kinase [Candidatus Woesearchaeota archaeon]|nr:NAD(+)/NADH kinase [Candidatus Woesearchaeota archaeon]
MKPKNAAVVYHFKGKSLRSVCNVLKKNNIQFSILSREKLNEKSFENKDLIIAIGGDGTFLRASHFIGNSAILGINADPKNKEGFFMCCNAKSFENKFRNILKNNFKKIKLNRLELKISNKKISTPALNEVYVGSAKAYHTSNYEIFIDGKKEIQKSSGILVAAAAGSTAWIKSAGGKKLSLTSKKIQYLVREPYSGRISGFGLKKGFANKIKIKALKQELVVVIDSLTEEHPLKKGSIAEIAASSMPLTIIK